MQFLTLEQAQVEPYMRQYRHSKIIATLGAGVLMAMAAVCLYFGYEAWIQKTIIGMMIAGWVGLWAAFFGLILGGIARRRMLPSNWLVRTHTDGISIKFRSYLNCHFDPADAIVVHIQYPEIEYVRHHRIRQDVPGQSRSDMETRFLWFAEFELRDIEALRKLEERLSLERARKAPLAGRFIRSRKSYGDYPVQVADGFLRIRWSVWPRLSGFLADISAAVPVKEKLSTREDFSDLRKAPPREQEDALLRLIAAGDRFGAIRIIRQTYGYDLTHAVKFLDDLNNTKPHGANSR